MSDSYIHITSHKHHHGNIEGKNLLIASLLNLIITIAEIIGGLISNSLALLSDAFHNLGDTFAVILAYFANIMGRRVQQQNGHLAINELKFLPLY
jgi:cobalt-zinc-cadmium efflux system protein